MRNSIQLSTIATTTTTLLLLLIVNTFHSCDAFVINNHNHNNNHIHNSKVVVTTTLYAESIEGWKINGIIKPVNNFILIEKEKEQSESDGGILLSKSAKIKKSQGKVLSVGPGKPHPDSGKLFPMPVSPGDNVVFGEFDGTEIKIDDKTHTLIRDSDILIKYSGDALTLESVETVNDGILVSVQTKEESSAGGLILSTGGSDTKRPSTGEVVKVGPGRMAASGEMIPMNVSIGDQVKFIDFAGNEVKIGDEEYSMVRMSEVLAKF